MADKIQLRGDTAANWTAANPVLSIRETGLILDINNKIVGQKFGDGVSNWNDLEEFASGGGGGDITLNKTTPEITTGVLTLDWATKNKLIANKAAGGGVDAAADFQLTFANEENAFEGKLHLNVTADLVITVTENLVSPDTRWDDSTNELVLLTGRYLLLIDDDVLTVSDILV